MTLGIEQPDEGRDEAIILKHIAKLIVDLHECRVEVGAEPERHAQHGVHLRDRQRRRDAVAGGIGEHGEQALIEQRQVEGIPSGQLGGLESAIHFVAHKRRHGGRQGCHLNHARRLELVAHLFAFDQVVGHAHALQSHRALGRQHRGKGLVVLVEHAALLVQDLHHAHQHILVVHERQRQHAARSVP